MNTIVFDLDGTLLDSAPDIIASLECALKTAGIEFIGPISSSIIGPPVQSMIERLGLKRTNEQELQAIKLFRQFYDSSIMPFTRPYFGAANLLIALKRQGWKIFLATNKPTIPTTRLLNIFFDGLIDDFCCVDTVIDRKLSKREMLVELTAKYCLQPEFSIMVGDSSADIKAGREMGWKTIAVEWGYGTQAELRLAEPTHLVGKMQDILDFIKNIELLHK